MVTCDNIFLLYMTLNIFTEGICPKQLRNVFAERIGLSFFLLITALSNRLILIQAHVELSQVSHSVFSLVWFKMHVYVCVRVCAQKYWLVIKRKA